MYIDPKFFEMTFEAVGVRNSQKRLKSLIADQAVEPLNHFQDELHYNFELVAEILMKRIAKVIGFWCQHKHDPIAPQIGQMMSEITNSAKNDVSLGDFYKSEVKAAIYNLAPMLALEVPDTFTISTDELEYVLLELEEKYEAGEFGQNPSDGEDEDSDTDYNDYYEVEDAPASNGRAMNERFSRTERAPAFGQKAAPQSEAEPVITSTRPRSIPQRSRDRAIVSTRPVEQVIEVSQPKNVMNMTLTITVDQAWSLIYGLIGYPSDYVQNTLLPRWQNAPEAFDKDRRFLYGLFIDTLRNAAGLQSISGNLRFADRDMTIDQLWAHYFTDLSQNIAPQLASAKLQTSANETWLSRFRKGLSKDFGNMSIIWMVTLGIALIFDGLTTYISLDQTPMETNLVLLFSFLITALFQIADQLVINYRKREFEAEALSAKFRAQFERLSRAVEELDVLSDSYVQLTMEKSKANANWKATEDNRRMSRRGRFWSARIADINVIVTAYGFSFLFLNSAEPMQAIFEQMDFILSSQWERLDVWVFLMVGLAVTVSFVVNTAQRTEILGWSMRRMKNEV